MRIPVCRNTSTVAHDQNAARLLVGEVPPPACGQADGIDPAGLSRAATLEVLVACGEPASGGGGLGGVDATFGVLALLLDGPQQRRQQR